MRMTNEEFQAEVFRRSAAYQREHTRRIRIMTRAAAAFAGCLLLTVGVGVAVSRNGLQRADNTAATSGVFYGDNSKTDAENSECAEGAAENSCEDSAEDSFYLTNGKNDTADSAADAAPGLSNPREHGEEQDQLGISGEDSFEEPEHAVFVKKTEAEILARYGLDAMPETLGGLTLSGVTNEYNYEDGKPGFIVSEKKPELIVSDTNTFCYRNPDDPSQYVSLTMYTDTDADTPVTYAVSGDPDRREEDAALTVSGLGVRIKADHIEHEALEQIVAELTDYLKEHKPNG